VSQQDIHHYDLCNQSTLDLVILSDSHGTVDHRILALIKPNDIVLHAGDIMDSKLIDEIEERAQQVIAVQGNNDVKGRYTDIGAQRLDALPQAVKIALPGGVIAMEHGHLILDFDHYHEILRDTYRDVRMIIFGHTHIAAFDNACLPWVVNPGASGKIRNHGGPSCITVSIKGDEWTTKRHRFADVL